MAAEKQGVSNAPFVRPELNRGLKELKFIQEKQYPIGKCSIE